MPNLQKTTMFTAAGAAAQREWFVVDLKDQTLGRAATRIASVLRGKHKPTYTPHVDDGDFVIVVNADKVRLTGDKWTKKSYQRHSQYPGGIRELSAAEMRRRFPERIIRYAVWGMLPKGPLGRKMLKKLKIYAGPEHKHAAQQPRELAV